MEVPPQVPVLTPSSILVNERSMRVWLKGKALWLMWYHNKQNGDCLCWESFVPDFIGFRHL